MYTTHTVGAVYKKASYKIETMQTSANDTYTRVYFTLICILSTADVDSSEIIFVWQWVKYNSQGQTARVSHLHANCRGACDKEGSDQCPFYVGANQEIRVTSKLRIWYYGGVAAILPFESLNLELWNGTIKQLSIFCQSKILFLVVNTSTGDIYNWTPLDCPIR